jgi:putative transposase
MAQEAFAVDYIKEIREKDRGIGGVKLWHMYKRKFTLNSPLGRDRFEEVVDKYGLKVRLKVRKPKTTDSTHGLPTYPNLIKDLIPTAPNQLWVSDITYIVVSESDEHCGFCYLTLVMDAYTEEIKGHCVGDTLESKYSIMALKMALNTLMVKNKEGARLIHHSDRGVQYASRDYINLLNANGVFVSMTENGNPKENPQAERINSTVKNEILKGCIFYSVMEVKEAVDQAVDFYNNERPHMSIGMMVPAEAGQCIGEREMKWTSYRELAIKRSKGTTNTEYGLPLGLRHGSPSGLRPPVNP